MKFAVFALLLGGSALAVRSDLLSLQGPAFDGFPRLVALFNRLKFEMPLTVHLRKKNHEEVSSRIVKVIPLLTREETMALIADAAAKYRVPPAFVTSIVAAESNFNCGAISPKGAIGLMQLMPETAQQYGADPTVPAENIDAGTRYLHWLMLRYKNHRMSMQRVIAAYNAGPGVVDRYRGIPPYHETRCYVTRVLNFFKHFQRTHYRG